MSQKATLYYLTASPFSRTCQIVISHLGLDDKVELKEVNLAEGGQFSEEFTKVNPRQQIPFLVDGNVKLTESKAICIYLCEKYATNNNKLYPANDLETRSKINELLFYDASEVDVIVLLFRFKFYGEQVPASVNEKLKKVLTFLDTSKLGARFAVGESYTLADIALCCTLSFLEVIDFKFTDYPNVEAYYKFVGPQIPKFEELTTYGMDFIKRLMESKKA